MKIQIPKPLIPGDKIAITAPSSGVPKQLHPQLDLAIEQLKLRGYDVIEGACLRREYKNSSADHLLRAAELMQFLLDLTIKAVMPPWGGELAMEILELLDFEALKAVEAKWFSGFSDVSTLHVPLTTISGWATLHGPNLMELAYSPLDATTEKIWDVLQSPEGAVIEQFSSELYQDLSTNSFAEQKGYSLTEKTQWKLLNSSKKSLNISGILIGGCLDTLGWLAGTKYADLPKFYQQHQDQGVILYLENVELAPCTLTRALLSLKMKGWFDNIAGILLGRSAATKVTDSHLLTYEEALQNVFEDIDIPILYDVDIGHIPPQLSLVNGTFAGVFYDNGKGRLVQRL